MPVIVQSLLALIQYAPAAISEISSVYAAIKGDLSATDQATIEKALVGAQAADAQATAAANAALTEAEQR